MKENFTSEDHKALYTLALKRLNHTFPTAVDRNDELKKNINSIPSDFPGIRFTGLIDEAISKTYRDAFETEKICLALANTINGMPEEVKKRMVDVEKIIQDGKQTYYNIMSEDIFFPSTDLPF